MQTMFDPATLLNTEILGANATEIMPCPVGDWEAILYKVSLTPWRSNDGSKSGGKLVNEWHIQDPSVKELLSRDVVIVRQDIMLDLTATGGLDMGKGMNVSLGRLREALGMNDPNRPFRFSDLEGRMARVRVSHRPYTDGTDRVASEIREVAKL